MRWLTTLAALAVLQPGCQPAPSDPPPPPETPLRPGSDWPGFLGPGRDGRSPELGLISPWPKEGPRLVWSCPLGAGYAPPSVSDGRLFHFDRFGNSARVTARSAQTGAQLWTFEYPTDYEDSFGYSNGPRCCPVIDGDRVYTHGAEGVLHCLGVADGKLIWKVDTFKDFGVVPNFFGVGSTPIFEGELLICSVGGSPPGTDSGINSVPDRKGNGSGLVAFDKRTGAVRWKSSDELASYSSPAVATVHGRRVGLLLGRHNFLTFDPADGKVDVRLPWKARLLESVNACTPLVIGDVAFITECYGFDKGGAALRLKPGGGFDTVWSDADKGRNKSLACHWATPVHADGYLYGSTGRNTNGAELRCVELNTGKVRWREAGLGRASLLYADGHLICLAEEGVLLLLKATPEGYRELSRVERPELSYPSWAAPVLARGLLYVRGPDKLLCLEAVPERRP